MWIVYCGSLWLHFNICLHKRELNSLNEAFWSKISIKGVRQKEWPRILNVTTNLGGKGIIDQYVQADRDGNGRVDQAEFTKLWMALKQEGPVSDPSIFQMP